MTDELKTVLARARSSVVMDRFDAVPCLRDLPGPEARDALVDLLDDECLEVIEAAAEALVVRDTESLDLTMEAWLAAEPTEAGFIMNAFTQLALEGVDLMAVLRNRLANGRPQVQAAAKEMLWVYEFRPATDEGAL